MNKKKSIKNKDDADYMLKVRGGSKNIFQKFLYVWTRNRHKATGLRGLTQQKLWYRIYEKIKEET